MKGRLIAEVKSKVIDEVKACKLLTLGAVVYTISQVVFFVCSLVKGKPIWFILPSIFPIWLLVASPKKYVIYENGIERLGRFILWSNVESARYSDGKLVLKAGDLTIRLSVDRTIAEELCRRIEGCS
jgi:hypothetical protein